MTTPPGPRPPGSPGDCLALAAVIDSYVAVIETGVSTVGLMASAAVIDRWTGRAAEYAQDVIAHWQGFARGGAGELTYLAGRLRRTAGDLEADIAAWQRRVDAYAATAHHEEQGRPR